jgi:DNA polymerase-3 subunit beta
MVSRKALVTELSLVSRVADNGKTIPVLANVLIESEGGDRVRLAGTDLECGLQCGCPAEVRSPGRGTVPARKLLDWAKLLPEGDVTVVFAEGDEHRVAVTSGRSKSRMLTLSAETFPEMPAMPLALAALPMGTLAAMVDRVGFAVSEEETRFTLRGALLEVGEGVVRMVATDGHRLALCEVDRAGDGFDDFRTIVPQRALAEMAKLAGTVEAGVRAEIGQDENHLVVRVGHRVLWHRKLSGSFPDYRRVLPEREAAPVVMPREQMTAALRRVVQFSDDRSKAVRLGLEAGEVVFHSSNGAGESEESLEGSGGAPGMEIAFNGTYLLDFLGAVPEDEVELRLTDTKASGELRPKADGGGLRYRYVVMPMRI